VADTVNQEPGGRDEQWKRALEYQSRIIDALHAIQATLPETSELRGTYEQLISEVRKETECGKLFMMWQSFREVLAKANDDPEKQDTSFKVRTVEGTIKEYKKLDEFLGESK